MDIYRKKDLAKNYEENATCSTREAKYLEIAAKMNKVVCDEFKTDNGHEMIKQLEQLAFEIEKTEDYVFKYWNVAGTFFRIFLCLLTSVFFIYFFMMGIATLSFSSTYYSSGILLVVTSVLFLSINVILVISGISAIRRKHRYDIYKELIGVRQFDLVEDISVLSKQKSTKVVKDLKKAVKNKLIPQGHFSKDNLVFMVSDHVYDIYLTDHQKYDQNFQRSIEKRTQVGFQIKKVKQRAAVCEQYIKHVNDYGILIKDKKIESMLIHLKTTVSMIFYDIEMNPKQEAVLGTFLDYYMSITTQIIDACYCAPKIINDDLNCVITKQELKLTLGKIIIYFDDILKNLYKDFALLYV